MTGGVKLPVNSHDGTNLLRLRAHHICCLPFLRTELEDRGSDYRQTKNKIKTLLSQPEAVITVIDGVDELCWRCLHCIDERCRSPQGNEDKVRKWDAILLKELGLPSSTCLTSQQWQEIIKQKIPFKLCQKCQWKQACSVGAKSSSSADASRT